MTPIIKNGTPHTINVVNETNETIKSFEPSGIVPRCKATTVSVGMLNQVSLTKTCYGEVEGLPDPEEGVYWIVSAMVFAASDRPDLLVPAEQVRDGEGRIVGCKSLGTR